MSAGTTTGGERVVAKLRGIASRLSQRVVKSVTEFALDVTALAKANSPLKTGRLRRSIHMEIKQADGRVDGIVGTNVVYAGVLENGFTGTQQVKEFTRTQTMAWGKPITPMAVTVKPFTRNVNRAARPFLAPALMAASPPLADRLRDDLRASK